jgi:hypothetical protein
MIIITTIMTTTIRTITGITTNTTNDGKGIPAHVIPAQAGIQ